MPRRASPLDIGKTADWSKWPKALQKQGLQGGLLYHGDNKEVLAHLLANGFRGQVKLIYIDPPFDSGADYVRQVQLRGPRGKIKIDGEDYALGEQVAAATQGELVARDDAPPAPAQLSFSTWRVNDYDLHIQHNEAVELASQHPGITRTRTDPFFDGTQGNKLAKIIPLNHPLTPLDLEALRAELKTRPDEERDLLVVSLGQEQGARLGGALQPQPADQQNPPDRAAHRPQGRRLHQARSHEHPGQPAA